jgi:hypothetical protein
LTEAAMTITAKLFSATNGGDMPFAQTPQWNPDATGPAPADSTIYAPAAAPLAAPDTPATTGWLLRGDDGQIVPTPTGAAAGGGGSGGGGTVSAPTASSGGLVINFTYDGSVASAPAGFKTALAAAAQYLESQFTNAVTVNITVGYGEVGGQAMGAGALGESMSYLNSYSYAQIKSALNANDTSAADASADATLGASNPTGGTLWVTSAQAKALGLSTTTGTDGYVGFSSTNPFDYNDADGVNSGSYDFYGTALHELTEVMGRMMLAGGTIGVTSNSYTPLDFFHYSAAGTIDHTQSQAGYFSVDGGKSSLGGYNTIAGGDAGDWGGTMGNDSFNAFSNSGVVNAVSSVDLTELNVIGWNRAGSTPPTPSVTIALATDTGTSASDHITSKDGLTGTAPAGATVTLSESGMTLGTATAGSSGAWSFTPSGLAQGSQTVQASVTVDGVTGQASLTFTLESQPPALTVALVKDTGTSASDRITSNTALQGATADDAKVTIAEGSKVLGTTTASATGAWSFTPTGLAQGAQTLLVTATDVAGNTASESFGFTYDSVAPKLTVALAHNSGGSATSPVTNNDALTGTNDANTLVTLKDGTTLLGTTTANGSGVWSFTPTTLAQGAQTIVASSTDLAGNTGSASLTFSYDTTPPVVTVSLASSSATTTGTALKGTGAAGRPVTITDAGKLLGTVTANSAGAWTFAATGLSVGAQTVTVASSDLAGNTGTAQLTFTVAAPQQKSLPASAVSATADSLAFAVTAQAGAAAPGFLAAPAGNGPFTAAVPPLDLAGLAGLGPILTGDATPPGAGAAEIGAAGSLPVVGSPPWLLQPAPFAIAAVGVHIG